MGTERAVVLAIDDEEIARISLRCLLEDCFSVELAGDSRSALALLRTKAVDIVLLDLFLNDGSDGIALLRTIKNNFPAVEVIIVSAMNMAKKIAESFREGAADYLTKPYEREDLIFSIEQALKKKRLREENLKLQQQLHDEHNHRELIGSAPSVQELKGLIARLRGHPSNVLISGESGTGKEVVARMIHRQEGDAYRPFVAVNCAAIPANLMESVLFGHEKGAFTGANDRRIGKFELADGGDIFLDEISTLPLDLQAKLLRVLQEKEIERIGANRLIKVHFRVIAATNENLDQLVAEKRFREDLAYRINVVHIHVPPLRERREDILPLARYFLKKYARGRSVKILTPAAEKLFLQHPWKGNVRELENTIENLIILNDTDTLDVGEIPFGRTASSSSSTAVAESAPETAKIQAQPLLQTATAAPTSFFETVSQFERSIILRALEKNRWHKTKTCKELHINRTMLYRKMNELKILK